MMCPKRPQRNVWPFWYCAKMTDYFYAFGIRFYAYGIFNFAFPKKYWTDYGLLYQFQEDILYKSVCRGKQISWANIDMKWVAWEQVYNFAYQWHTCNTFPRKYIHSQFSLLNISFQNNYKNKLNPDWVLQKYMNQSYAWKLSKIWKSKVDWLTCSDNSSIVG